MNKWKSTREARSRPRRTTPAQRVLTQWRGVDYAPLEIVHKDTVRAVSEVMGQLLSELGLDRRRKEAEIVKVWNHLIDPTLTAHAQPANLHNGTLFVNVDTSVWLDEIVRYRRKEILTRLQHSFGREQVKRISFRIG